MTLTNDEESPKTFVIPRDRFLALYNLLWQVSAMFKAKQLKDGDRHLVELKPQSEIAPPETEKKKKGIVEKIQEIQAGARKIADGMDRARDSRA